MSHNTVFLHQVACTPYTITTFVLAQLSNQTKNILRLFFLSFITDAFCLVPPLPHRGSEIFEPPLPCLISMTTFLFILIFLEVRGAVVINMSSNVSRDVYQNFQSSFQGYLGT